MLSLLLSAVLASCSGNNVTVATSTQLVAELNAGTTTVTAGCTVFIRGGAYLAPAGGFVSTLAGTGRDPTRIRSAPGEWAVLYIDEETGATTPQILDVQGSWQEFHDIALVNINDDRETTCGGGCPNPGLESVNRPRGFRLRGHHNKMIHVVSHDNGTNAVNDTDAAITGLTVYGSVLFNNGWDDTAIDNRGQSLYAKHNCTSNCTPHIIKDNIIFQDFNGAIQLSGQTSHVDNVVAVGNIVFLGTTGSRLASPDGAAQIVIDSETHAIANVTLRGNYTFTHRADLDTPSVVGWFGTSYANPVVAGSSIAVVGNYVTGINTLSAAIANLVQSGNTWYGRENHGLGGDPVSWHIGYDFDQSGAQHTFNDYVAFAGRYPSNTYDYQPPVVNVTAVLKDDYDTRCRIVVYNWAASSSVSVNLSSCLAAGDSYEILNAQDVYADPVVSSVYAGGSVALPMTGLTSRVPISTQSDHITSDERTGSEFNVFLLFKGAAPPYSLHGITP